MSLLRLAPATNPALALRGSPLLSPLRNSLGPLPLPKRFLAVSPLLPDKAPPAAPVLAPAVGHLPEQAELKARRTALETERATLQEKGARLEEKQAALEEKQASLEAEQKELKAKRATIADQIAKLNTDEVPTALHAHFSVALEDVEGDRRMARHKVIANLEKQDADLEKQEQGVRHDLDRLAAQEQGVRQDLQLLAKQLHELKESEQRLLQRSQDASQGTGMSALLFVMCAHICTCLCMCLFFCVSVCVYVSLSLCMCV
jgi:phage shock protein A